MYEPMIIRRGQSIKIKLYSRKALEGLNTSAPGNALLLRGINRKLKNLSKK
jgi:hypothetical protein